MVLSSPSRLNWESSTKVRLRPGFAPAPTGAESSRGTSRCIVTRSPSHRPASRQAATMWIRTRELLDLAGEQRAPVRSSSCRADQLDRRLPHGDWLHRFRSMRTLKFRSWRASHAHRLGLLRSRGARAEPSSADDQRPTSHFWPLGVPWRHPERQSSVGGGPQLTGTDLRLLGDLGEVPAAVSGASRGSVRPSPDL